MRQALRKLAASSATSPRESPSTYPSAPAAVGPLTAAHAQQLEALLETLSREEALWISGYLAAVDLGGRGNGVAVHPPAPPAIAPITILYGSETGHAAAIATRVAARAREMGLPARAVDMAEFRPQELKRLTRLVVVTATHGEGAPPDPAAGFYEFLHSRKAPRLPGMTFSVLGLGDSSYEHFCQTAKDFDRRLEELGARRLHTRTDCDIDFAAPAAAWMDTTLARFAADGDAPGPGAADPWRPGSTITVLRPHESDAEDGLADGHRTPVEVQMLESLVLSGRGSDKEVRHIEFALDGSGLAYEPGDSLGVVAENDPLLIHELQAILGLTGTEPVPGTGGERAVGELLARDYEITTLTPGFVARYAEAADAEALRGLIRAERRQDLRTYLAGRRIIDVVTEFPVKGLAAAAFVGMLRTLEPRLYSLASSQTAYSDEAHLTVDVLRYRGVRRAHKGVASTYLGERRTPGDTVPVYVARNKHFRLPADGSVPIIMVGAGTGVAPFRAFVQARQAAGATGRTWLFFGDRRFRTDFLYQLEWLRFRKEGALSRMDVAFSRDQAEKIYVQHRILEHGREVYAWLQDGAHLYVCGSSNRLAPGVHEALLTVVEREGRMSRAAAEEYVKGLARERRYQRDVY